MLKAGSLDGTKDPGPDVCLFATVSDEPLDLSEGLFGANPSFVRSRRHGGRGGMGGGANRVRRGPLLVLAAQFSAVDNR